MKPLKTHSARTTAEPRRINKTGIVLSESLMRDVRRGTADINAGRCNVFATAEEAIAHLHRKAGLR